MENLKVAFQATFSGSASNSQMGLVFMIVAFPVIVCVLTLCHIPKY